MSTDRDLLQQAAAEIRRLRRENEVLGAKVDTMELLGEFVRAHPYLRGSIGMGEDIAWLLDRRIEEMAKVEAAATPPEAEAFVNVERAANVVAPDVLVYRYGAPGTRLIRVHDGGSAIRLEWEADVPDLAKGTTTPGHYRTCAAEGLFQLGSAPVQRPVVLVAERAAVPAPRHPEADRKHL